MYVSRRRDIASARTFFTAALAVHGDPCEVITDRAPALASVIEDLIPAAFHNTGQYENNRVECDHGRLKARLRPMRRLKTHRTASVVIRRQAFIQNLRRGHYELAVDATPVFRFGHRIRRNRTRHLTSTRPRSRLNMACDRTTQQSRLTFPLIEELAARDGAQLRGVQHPQVAREPTDPIGPERGEAFLDRPAHQVQHGRVLR